MGSSRWLAFITVAWVSYANALDRAGAIEIAKRQVRGQCGPGTMCTFDATLHDNKWHVRVGVENRKPAIFVIDQSGRIVGRIEGK
jgi:hypothetical protein